MYNCKFQMGKTLSYSMKPFDFPVFATYGIKLVDFSVYAISVCHVLHLITGANFGYILLVKPPPPRNTFSP